MYIIFTSQVINGESGAKMLTLFWPLGKCGTRKGTEMEENIVLPADVILRFTFDLAQCIIKDMEIRNFEDLRWVKSNISV